MNIYRKREEENKNLLKLIADMKMGEEEGLETHDGYTAQIAGC